jgi:hypothetical protein
VRCAGPPTRRYATTPAGSLRVRSRAKAGGQGRNRTSDTVIFSHVLYQLSYLALRSAFRRTYRSTSIPSGVSSLVRWRSFTDRRSLGDGTEAPSDGIVGQPGLSARRVLTITAQFDLVSRLPAVITAVLSVLPLWFDHALTGGVCALGSSGHRDLRSALYAPGSTTCKVGRSSRRQVTSRRMGEGRFRACTLRSASVRASIESWPA